MNATNHDSNQRVTRRITVVNKLGLHARAAAKLVKLAAGFASQLELELALHSDDDTKTADAKSIMAVMTLAAAQGSEITLTARGADAELAAAAVCALFADRFGEGE